MLLVGSSKKVDRLVVALVLGLSLYLYYTLFQLIEYGAGIATRTRVINSSASGPEQGQGQLGQGYNSSLSSSWIFRNASANASAFAPVNKSEEKEQLCKIPQLDPDDPSIQHLLFDPPDPKCELNTTLLFNATLDYRLVPSVSVYHFRALGIRSCCYRLVLRRDSGSGYPDDGFRLSDVCHPVDLAYPTEVKAGHEFVAIFCRRKEKGALRKFLFGDEPAMKDFVDLKIFVHLKEDVEMRLLNLTSNSSSDDGGSRRPPQLNVALFGFDAVSRTNFIRYLPNTRQYLLEEMGAIELKGYNKVGPNTLPNLLVLLTSMRLPETMKPGRWARRRTFDEFPFIWKNFSEKGYRTAFVEDTSTMPVFNYDSYDGFLEPPTDYYFRHFTIAANFFLRRQQSGKITCFGHRLFIEVLLEHMTTFIWKMERESKPFFYFSWEGSLTHDELNEAKLGDEPTLKALKLLKEKKLLNRTLLIIASDHGMRTGPILNYRQGQLEDMLPFVYFVFPEWFPQAYPRAFQNLKGNTERFTTTLDLHFLLRDILNPEAMQNEEIERRERELQSLKKIPKGSSLFLPISLERTCKDTVISPAHYCICAQYELVNSSKELRLVRNEALVAVEKINKLVERYRSCATLYLAEVIMVQRRKGEEGALAYLIDFRTTPGEAEFQALVEMDVTGLWIVPYITRTNMYGDQGNCVRVKGVKEFCFCMSKAQQQRNGHRRKRPRLFGKRRGRQG